MTVDVTAIGDQLQQLSPRKYYIDRRRLADTLEGVSQDELVEFFRVVKQGGKGFPSNDDWEPNPAPYDERIDVETQSEDNILNLYKQANGRKSGSVNYSVLSDPTPSVLQERCDYCLIGNPRLRSKIITPTIQREMACVVIGTESKLKQFYPKLAEERRHI